MYRYIFCCCFFIFFFLNSIQARQFSDTLRICIRITDLKQQPIFGVYAIHQTKNYLIGTSDIDGECFIHPALFSLKDSIQFQGMGYKVKTYCLNDLLHLKEIRLEELSFELEETVVKSIAMEELLKKASEQLKKINANQLPLCRRYGESQYEKITEYNNNTLEYRREYGYYFTSGNVKAKNVWDKAYRSYFVPYWSSRSYNLTNNSSDTLSPVYMTTDEIRFDAGTRKIFTLFRTVLLYAPLFTDTRFYEIHPVDNDSSCYIFSFQTKPSAYPDNLRISCKGTFSIDNRDYRLKNITFDYIDYQLFRQVLLSDKRKTSSPYSTKASLDFAYDTTGQVYIRSCRQETIWKYDLGNDFIVLEQPSRMHPASGKLVEKEAFYCYNYRPIAMEKQTPRILTKIHVAQRNPIGKYDPLVFKPLPLLLENQKAIEDLNKFTPIETQFIQNDNRPYYPDNFVNGFNGFNGKGRDDKAYKENIKVVYQQLFEIFRTPRLPEK